MRVEMFIGIRHDYSYKEQLKLIITNNNMTLKNATNSEIAKIWQEPVHQYIKI
jgi:hypothetical protein